MIMSEQTIPIPGRLKNVAIGGHVAGSEDIDAGEGKTQKQVNDEINDTLALHQSEISGLNSQNYVSVSSYSSLPATGSADTIYRVSSWDGNANSGEGAADVTKYTEYAWNGTTYIVVDVKTQIGEVFDISEYKAVGGTLAKFADLSAALDGGNNVPAGIRKCGMSVKFVQSSDNKYVQYRLMSDSFNTTPANWQGVDDEPTAGSDNLVKSGGVFPLTALKYYADNILINATAFIPYWNKVNWAQGTKFIITNKTEQYCTAAIYDITQSSSLQALGNLEPNSTNEFSLEPNVGECYVLLYPNGNGILNIELADKVIPKLEKEVENINNTVDSIKSNIEVSINLLNLEKLSQWGYWCNYLDGTIESTQYVVNYAYSEYIKVKPNTQYSRNYSAPGTVFFNKDKYYVGYSQQEQFTTPANCEYIIANVTKESASYLETMIVEGTSLPSGYIPYYYDFKYLKPNKERDYYTIGVGGDFNNFVDVLSACSKTGKYLVILPGVYNIVQEGIIGTYEGFYWPKKVIGYGATIMCHLPSENWDISPFNIHESQDSFEIYGLTIDCENCRYCIHDEMGRREQGKFYHNVFKDLHLIHRSEPSATLIAPQCIGGGLGDCGYIEIDNCVFDAKIRDVTYHSLATNPQREQTGECEIKITNCYFSHKPTAAQIGDSTNYMNTMYVSACSLGEVLTDKVQANIKIIDWSNEVRQ